MVEVWDGSGGVWWGPLPASSQINYKKTAFQFYLLIIKRLLLACIEYRLCIPISSYKDDNEQERMLQHKLKIETKKLHIYHNLCGLMMT